MKRVVLGAVVAGLSFLLALTALLPSKSKAAVWLNKGKP